MNKREFSKHIKELLQLDDFKAIGVGSGSVSLVRGEEEIIISYSKYPNKFVLPPAITGRKCFSKVEDVLEKYFISHKINYGRNTIFTNSRRIDNLQLRTIEDTKDFSKVTPDLKEMVFTDILPFFKSNRTLELLHDNINQMEISELSKFIMSPVHPRIMVIKRLLNASDWESYCEDSIEMYKEQSEGKYKAVFEPILKFLPDLLNELKDYNQR